MSESRAALRYAKAALETAVDAKATKAVEADMQTVLETLKGSPELSEVLGSPVVSGDQKKEVLLSIFGKTHEISQRLFGLLTNNKRVGLLGEVASKYIYLNDLTKGEKVAEITTAVPLTSELEKQILDRVTKLTGTKVILENKIDEDVVGGFILRIGDLQLNASIANQLNNLKREFVNI